MMEIYTPERKEYHKHNTGNAGTSNGRALVTENDVRNIRLRKIKGESSKQVYEDYKDILKLPSFYDIWSNRSWKNVKI